jgi:Planctomycete cytochrome C
MKPWNEPRYFNFWLGLGFAILTLAAAHPRDQVGDRVFEQEVQPILQARCMPCHDAKTRSSGLSVLTKADLLAGGARRGPAVVPGDPESSALIKMLYGQISPQMPFGQDPLPPERINQIAAWVRGLQPEAVSLAGSEKWWAFQPVKRTEAPAVKNSS